jgi:hypothetical protein
MAQTEKSCELADFPVRRAKYFKQIPIDEPMTAAGGGGRPPMGRFDEAV